MNIKHYIDNGTNGDAVMASNVPCTGKQVSVNGLILDNHRMVDTASDRLSYILEMLRERLDGVCPDGSDGSGCSNDDLPTGAIPLLDDMLGCQVSNNDKIEDILRVIDNSL